MTELYKLSSKYNNLKELSSADRTKDDNLVVLSTSKFNALVEDNQENQ